MSRSVGFVFCLILILTPMVAWAGASANSCDAGAASVVNQFVDPFTGLPKISIEFTTSSAFSCPFAFESASFCYQCWDALNQCSGPNCYPCTEVCLGRLGCWIP
ncbi:MAG: hypothetical protein MPN21_15470 [Thermoanaerobaculia bacterium]|nr:hypothetical protein [Thermoanaerobaculia bacterium]